MIQPILLHETNVDKTSEKAMVVTTFTDNECKPCPEGHAPVVKMTRNGGSFKNTHAHICEQENGAFFFDTINDAP